MVQGILLQITGSVKLFLVMGLEQMWEAVDLNVGICGLAAGTCWCCGSGLGIDVNNKGKGGGGAGAIR